MKKTWTLRFFTEDVDPITDVWSRFGRMMPYMHRAALTLFGVKTGLDVRVF